MKRTCLGIVLVAAWGLAAAPRPALADERSDAAQLVREGVALMQEGRNMAALERFDQAYARLPSPKILFNVGLAQKKLGRSAEAHRTFSKVLREAGADMPPQLLENAREQLKELEPLVSRLRVTVNQAGAQIEIDGQAIGASPLPDAVVVAPGPHVLVVSKEGFGRQQQTVKLETAETQAVTVTLLAGGGGTGPAVGSPPGGKPGGATAIPAGAIATPTPTAEPAQPKRTPIYKRWWFWTAIGVAVVGGTVGGVLGARAGGGGVEPAPASTLGDKTYPP
jgi:hypothetical protein